MPIYEYRCADCERSFEALVSASRPDAECPACGGSKISREMSVFASRSNGVALNSGGDSIPAPSAMRGGCCGGACGCR